MRAGDGRGHCHHLQWTPGTNSWGGVLWQYPANNWGSAPGFAMPRGYAQVRFRAWGQTGGEKVSFLVGLGAGGRDQFQERLDVTLAAQPTLYVLGVRGAYRDKVVSAFGWVTSAAAAQTFYIDDIVWTGDERRRRQRAACVRRRAEVRPHRLHGRRRRSASSPAAAAPRRRAAPTAATSSGIPTATPAAPRKGGPASSGRARPATGPAPPIPTAPPSPPAIARCASAPGARTAAARPSRSSPAWAPGTRDGWQSKLDVQLDGHADAVHARRRRRIRRARRRRLRLGRRRHSGIGFNLDGASWR